MTPARHRSILVFWSMAPHCRVFPVEHLKDYQIGDIRSHSEWTASNMMLAAPSRMYACVPTASPINMETFLLSLTTRAMESSMFLAESGHWVRVIILSAYIFEHLYRWSKKFGPTMLST